MTDLSERRVVAVILTFNSSAVAERTVRAAQRVADHVFVVDSFSSDGTRDVVERLGCRVVTRAFKHYADQRNWAIQELANDWPWQLHLDADEVLDERAIVALRAALADPGSQDGFLLKRLTYFMGKPLRFAGEKSWHLRLFRSGRAACEDRLYDQHFTCRGATRKLPGLLHDLNAGTLSEWTARHNRWSDLESAEMLRPSNRVDLLESKISSDPRKRRRYYKGIYYRLPRGWRALGYFVFRYVLQLGFLDGRAGFYYNFLQALWFRMLVDAKLAEATSAADFGRAGAEGPIHAEPAAQRLMGIGFLAASLEPGRDGVGDYARNLAAACEALGHRCSLVALNDRWVEAPVEQRQAARGVELEVLRLPPSLSWSRRIALARRFLERGAPDWLSLQFGPYGFHPRGWILGLGSRLVPLTDDRRLHLMFHELWTGGVVGALQQMAVVWLVGRLGPEVVHTTNSTYLALLAARGVRAGLLPLAGNIPIAPPPSPGRVDDMLAAAGVPAELAHSRAAAWRFALFGSMHPGWSPGPLLTRIAEAAAHVGRRVVVVSVGRLGAGEPLWRQMEAQHADRISFATLGERTAEEVSMCFQDVDFGIATTPWELIGKSGAAAAMIDHGLPVIVARDDVTFPGIPAQPADPLLYRAGDDLAEWLRGARRAPPRERLPDVARCFVEDLGSAGALPVASSGARAARS